MAVFTPVNEDEAARFLEGHDLGRVIALTPIAEGVENSNFRLDTPRGRFVLTLVERRTAEAELPFVLGLAEYLAAAGVATPRPVRDRAGRLFSPLNGKPAVIAEWAHGAWPRRPTAVQLDAAGRALARFHLAGQAFDGDRANPVGPAAWRRLATRCAERATGEDRQMLDALADALPSLEAVWSADLPRGPGHGDYFPDNVLFDGERVTGVIDLYFACVDSLAYDLAIALVAWGFDGEGRRLDGAAEALLEGYEIERPLGAPERAALPALQAAAAARFTLTRLHDRLFHDPAWLVTPKDPAAFFRRFEAFAGALDPAIRSAA